MAAVAEVTLRRSVPTWIPPWAPELRLVPYMFEIRGHVLRPGERHILAEAVGEAIVPVYGHLIADNPYVGLVFGHDTALLPGLFGDVLTIEELYRAGIACPYVPICFAKYDTSEKIFTMLVDLRYFRPELALTRIKIDVAYVPPPGTDSPATIYNARTEIWGRNITVRSPERLLTPVRLAA
jgi:hypothetical protein